MVHCNTFTNSNSSFFLSASPTNVLGTTIMGIQCFITYNNEIINFSTYNKGKITHFKKEGKTFSIELCNKTHRLNITAIPKQYGRLKVPSFRNKEWYIYESANAIIYLDLFKDNELLKCEEGINTGFELVEGFSELIESHLKSI